ncbi:monothiol glutaredoxin-4, putative [Pediculus humanus corporis]|uniref:Monothiol glutaredoxin-4, putative n=1 Tax=Pediculus humanus subsp. corporis TaxID=121224 RepID=E0VTK1_PEDHC|nr:monothiol glutaredoxin-4, putative [Pediculus humanus corporis]EEB16728.1 monothiol glutaredoxin-4, putative [Pediculus humanus corporis]
MTVTKIVSKNEFEGIIGKYPYVIVNFYAEWASQCAPMNSVLDEMAKLDHYKKIHFAKIEAEVVPEVSVLYKISAVPTILIFKDGVLAETVNGANPAELMTKLSNIAKISPISLSTNIKPVGDSLDNRLKMLINLADVMIFMKGNPSNPRCGFSRTLIGIMNETRVPYQTFDILNDEDVRQGLKKYSNWPTYPQVYVKGELVGGLDIIQELHKNGELMSILQPK